jgi:hypothetical protein
VVIPGVGVRVRIGVRARLAAILEEGGVARVAHFHGVANKLID